MSADVSGEPQALPPASCFIRRPSRTGYSTSTRTDSSTGWPPPASAGGRCCPLGPPEGLTARRTCRRRRSRARPSCSPPARPRAARRGGRVPRAERVLDRRLARHGGDARRPGPVRARVAGAPRVRGGTRRPHLRRHPDLRRARRRRPPRASRALPVGRGRRRAARRLHEDRPALGQPAVRLAGDARTDGYRWWIERLRRMFDARRPDAASTTSAASSRTGRSRRGSKTAAEGRWRRGPGGDLFRAADGGARATCRVVAEDLGVITEPVVRLRHELGLPGMVVLQFALGDGPDEPAPARRTTRSTPSSTPGRTTTTRRSAGGSR